MLAVGDDLVIKLLKFEVGIVDYFDFEFFLITIFRVVFVGFKREFDVGAIKVLLYLLLN